MGRIFLRKSVLFISPGVWVCATTIEHHLPLMESAGDLDQLLEVKAFFETELKVSRRLH